MLNRIVVCGVVFVAAALFGCGGGGSGGIKDRSLIGTMSVNPPLADPGQAVDLTFSVQHMATAGCNFTEDISQYQHGGSGVDGSNLDGTITVHPTVSETFTLELMGVWNDHLELTTTVTVKPTSQKYVVVGDPANAGVIAAVNALQSLSTQAVDVQTTIPVSDGGVDAIVLHQTGSFGTAEVPTIRAYLQQGKGVVILGASPRKLATGDANNVNPNNIAAIQSWFGAGPTLGTSSGNAHANAGSFVPVPLSLVHSSRSGIGPLFVLDQANPGADIVCRNSTNNWFFAFGYRPSEGGRLYYQPGATFLDDPILLAAGARWAATGP